MFDRLIQQYTQKPMRYISKIFLKFISPNHMTLIGFSFGILMCVSIVFNQFSMAIIFLFLNRISDGLDGAMARLQTITPLGGYLDIVFDLLIYAGFVLSFGLSDTKLVFICMLLLFSYFGTASTFLAEAAILRFNQLDRKADFIPKSFFYASGIVEGFETIIFMTLCLVFVEKFILISIIFIILCNITTFFRILVFYKKYNY